jgi:histidinol-phosphate aminotransferase
MRQEAVKRIDVRNLVKPVIRGIRAYEAKEIPSAVKLHANESPYSIDGQFSTALKEIETNRYPDPEARELKKIAAKWFGADPSMLLQGNGSDELIYYIVSTFGGPVLYPEPTFTMYGHISRTLGEKVLAVPLDDEFDIDLGKTISAIRRGEPKLIFLSIPNNPTGNYFSPEKTAKVLCASKGIVVIDEAYHPFSDREGFMPLLKEHKNLVIMKTVSKIGLAALRIGFLIADTEIIEEVNKVRLPFNVNALSQAVGARILEDRKGLRRSIRAVIRERKRLLCEMRRMEWVSPFPSEANFILFKVGDPDGLYKALLKRGVLLRNLNDIIEGCLRVTVGTQEENNVFLEALRASLP